MAHTSNFLLLIKRNMKLKKALLPKKYSPMGYYKDLTYERVSAYKLLVHAEIEYYFEEVVKEIAMQSYKGWIEHKKVTKALISLIAYCDTKFLAVPTNTTDQRKADDLNQRIKTAHTCFNKYIRSKNNGIKEKDLLAMLLPIGIQISEIPEGLIIALENFGNARGTIAHSTRVQQCISPQDAANDIQNIISLIDDFDANVFVDYLNNG